mmetsp:Transcript_103572/g.163530  ORF Transcript_103572/g.163530 Transcript_103572/m.163530 type:complete len:562 (+) Transcript_103572:104-1789(+)
MKPWEVHHPSDQESDPGSKQESETIPLISKSSPKSLDFFGFNAWLIELEQTFGRQLLVLLFSIQHLLKGFVFEFYRKANPYIFKLYHIPAPQAQVYVGVASLPWALKPMIGLMSDICPIWGYNKAPYLIGATICGVSALSYLGLSTVETSPITVIVMCLFMVILQISTCDLLSEARYSEDIKVHSHAGPSMLTYTWGGMQVFGLLAIAFSGAAVQYLGVRWMYLICVVPAALVLVPVLMGYVGEKRVSEEQKLAKRRRFAEEQEMCWLCVIMFVATVTMTIAGILIKDTFVNAMLGLSIGVVVLVCFSFALSPVIAKFNAFALIQTACMLSTNSAAFYFYTDSEEQYPATETSPGGPHFSMMFFNSGIGSVGAVCSLLGIWSYKRYLSQWRYRHLLVFTNVVYSCLACADVVVFSRLNRRWGIPDEFFVLGAQGLENVLEQWMWMPQVVILSYMVPQGMEATMYALLAGCHNLGFSIAQTCGGLALDLLGCHPRGAIGETDQFKNLWVAASIAIVLPLVAICLLFWLIPDAPQTENFALDDSATKGSLWKQLIAGWTSAAP